MLARKNLVYAFVHRKAKINGRMKSKSNLYISKSHSRFNFVRK